MNTNLLSKLKNAGILIGSLLIYTAPASAQIWNRQGTAPANTLNTAQITGGVGSLTTITGELRFQTEFDNTGLPIAFPSEADLFRIRISGDTFTATTVEQPGTLDNTVLFLFDAQGRGIARNDDDPDQPDPFGTRSTLNLTGLTPGDYFLGIAPFGEQATSADGLIFPDERDFTLDPTLTNGPTGPGGSAPLSGWNRTLANQATGSYQIALSGAGYAVPEPSALSLLGAGGLVLVLGLRRRKK